MDGAVILSIWCGQAGETDQCARAPAAQDNLTGPSQSGEPTPARCLLTATHWPWQVCPLSHPDKM